MDTSDAYFVDPEGLAVLVIDMQYDFLDKKKLEIVPHQDDVIRRCRELNITIVVVEYKNSGEMIPALSGTLEKYPNRHHVTKNSNSAFDTSNIDEILKGLGVTKLLLMGVNACACVLETAQDAVKEGYEIITSDMLIAGCCHACNHDNYTGWYSDHGTYLVSQLPVFHKEELMAA